MNDISRKRLDRQIRDILEDLLIWRRFIARSSVPPSDRVLACVADLKLELRSRLVRWADLAG